MSEKKQIGALWKKLTQGGKELWAGNVEIEGKKMQIAVFKNSYKTADRQPDFIVYFDNYKPSERPASKPMDEEFPAAPNEDDGLPF